MIKKKLIEGHYKIKFGENDEGKIAQITNSGDLLIKEERFIWNNDKKHWKNEQDIEFRIEEVIDSIIGYEEYPNYTNIYFI